MNGRVMGPHVAGAADIVAAHPDYTPGDVQAALRAAATPGAVQDTRGTSLRRRAGGRPPLIRRNQAGGTAPY